MKISDQSVGPDSQTYIIAEAGSNHDGSLEQAKKLVDIAADSGADAVKFQTFRADKMYPAQGSSNDELLDLIVEAEMPYNWIPKLSDYCSNNNIHFLSSPFDTDSVDRLKSYVPAFKIASSMLSHYPLLEYIAKTGKPVIVSTGAHTREEIQEAVNTLQDAGVKSIVLLHCVSAYPTPLDQINVSAVRSLGEYFDIPVGFSDHTLDPTIAPTAAVSHGASVIEKHFTVDRTLEGMDHSHSLEPTELSEMVNAIRATEKSQGDGVIGVQTIEQDWRENAKRSIQAVRTIDVGEKIQSNSIDILRSGKNRRGVHPKHYNQIIGATVTEAIDAGDGIQWENIDQSPKESNKK
jgi:N-acetylneuraminate synthase